MHELWAKGICGTAEFARRNWLTLGTIDMGGWFSTEWFRKLFFRIGNKLGRNIIKDYAHDFSWEVEKI